LYVFPQLCPYMYAKQLLKVGWKFRIGIYHIDVMDDQFQFSSILKWKNLHLEAYEEELIPRHLLEAMGKIINGENLLCSSAIARFFTLLLFTYIAFDICLFQYYVSLHYIVNLNTQTTDRKAFLLIEITWNRSVCSLEVLATRLGSQA